MHPAVKFYGQFPKVGAYAVKTAGQIIAPDVFFGAAVGPRRDLQSGDGTAGIFGAQQQSQRAAAGSQIQHLGIFWKVGKVGQNHRIGTQRECPFSDFQGVAVG